MYGNRICFVLGLIPGPGIIIMGIGCTGPENSQELNMLTSVTANIDQKDLVYPVETHAITGGY
jgi:hypothetical protein